MTVKPLGLSSRPCAGIQSSGQAPGGRMPMVSPSSVSITTGFLVMPPVERLFLGSFTADAFRFRLRALSYSQGNFPQ